MASFRSAASACLARATATMASSESSMASEIDSIGGEGSSFFSLRLLATGAAETEVAATGVTTIFRPTSKNDSLLFDI